MQFTDQQKRHAALLAAVIECYGHCEREPDRPRQLRATAVLILKERGLSTFIWPADECVLADAEAAVTDKSGKAIEPFFAALFGHLLTDAVRLLRSSISVNGGPGPGDDMAYEGVAYWLLGGEIGHRVMSKKISNVVHGACNQPSESYPVEGEKFSVGEPIRWLTPEEQKIAKKDAK